VTGSDMTGPALPTVATRGTPSARAEAIRSTVSLIVVLVGIAFCLRLLDELPGAAAGVSRGVRRMPSMEALAGLTGLRIPVPAFFPDTLQWPPNDVLSFGGTSASAWFRHRTDRGTWLLIAVAKGAREVAPQVLPAAIVLQSEPTLVGTHAAVAARLQDTDGVVWHQVSWNADGEARLVRYRGTLDELMTLAGSLSERGH
jgi:hypothetical protein